MVCFCMFCFVCSLCIVCQPRLLCRLPVSCPTSPYFEVCVVDQVPLISTCGGGQSRRRKRAFFCFVFHVRVLHSQQISATMFSSQEGICQTTLADCSTVLLVREGRVFQLEHDVSDKRELHKAVSIVSAGFTRLRSSVPIPHISCFLFLCLRMLLRLPFLPLYPYTISSTILHTIHRYHDPWTSIFLI